MEGKQSAIHPWPCYRSVPACWRSCGSPWRSGWWPRAAAAVLWLKTRCRATAAGTCLSLNRCRATAAGPCLSLNRHQPTAIPLILPVYLELVCVTPGYVIVRQSAAVHTARAAVRHDYSQLSIIGIVVMLRFIQRHLQPSTAAAIYAFQ